jgi:hypothetical protein
MLAQPGITSLKPPRRLIKVDPVQNIHLSLTDTTFEQRSEKAYSQGLESAKAGIYDCSYYSGSGLKKSFDNGFVAHASKIEELPANTPMYLAGRVAFLKGLPLESKPESESYAGRWFSGWRMEKERLSK